MCRGECGGGCVVVSVAVDVSWGVWRWMCRGKCGGEREGGMSKDWGGGLDGVLLPHELTWHTIIKKGNQPHF
jgi:hypothetical protein